MSKQPETKTPVVKPKRILNLSGCKLEQLPEKAAKNNNWKIMILDNNRLTTLPVEVHMRTMILAHNRFGDNVPPEIVQALSQSVKLRDLDLSGNKLKYFPDELNNNRDLEIVNLFDNKLSSINITSTKFHTLNIGHNSFSSPPSVPENITTLGYSYNILEQFNESFPNINNLINLSLNQCSLKCISPTLCCSNMKRIELSMNNLSDIPDIAQLAPQLETIDLSDNFLTVFPNLPLTIKEVNVSGNQITELPKNISSLTSLQKINVSHNQIIEFPPLAESIVYIDASYNQIDVVSEFDAPVLELVNFTSNNLITIPIFRTTSLKIYLLGNNRITYINVDAISPAATLLNLFKNQITEIPSAIYSKAIDNINLYGNQIQNLPYDLSSWTGLSILNISNNKVGTIPPVPTGLAQLFAGYCGLTSLPENITECQKLVVLSVPGNHISSIPLLPAIRLLNASRNKLIYFPEMPETIESLDVSFNGISAFPAKFIFPNLVEMDASHNFIMNGRGFSRTRLKSLRINNNPISTSISPICFPFTLTQLDLSNTEIKLLQQPQVSEVLADENPNRWCNIKIIRTGSYCSIAQMKGLHESTEDSVIVQTNVRNNIDLVGVFDGHGGSITSMYSSKQFGMLYETQDVELSVAGLEKVLKRLEQSIRENKLSDGSTCGLAVMAGQQALVTTIGDVRVIVVKDNGKIKFETNDHRPSERAEFERIKKNGGYVINHRTMGVVGVSRALGDFSISGISPLADINYVEFEPDDKYLIVACDGVFDVMTNEQVGQMAAAAKNCDELAYDIRNVAFSSYSTDNISVVVVDLHERVHSIYHRTVEKDFNQ